MASKLGWMIKDKEGNLYVDTFNPCGEANCIDGYYTQQNSNVRIAPFVWWESLTRKGYDCVKVQVVEIFGEGASQ